jgi:hypothetical protein
VQSSDSSMERPTKVSTLYMVDASCAWLAHLIL